MAFFLTELFGEDFLRGELYFYVLLLPHSRNWQVSLQVTAGFHFGLPFQRVLLVVLIEIFIFYSAMEIVTLCTPMFGFLIFFLLFYIGKSSRCQL